MHAYRILRGEEGTNSVPPSTLAAAMTERKERHRVPRSAMIAGLLTVADLPVTKEMLAKAQRVQTMNEQRPLRAKFIERAQSRAHRFGNRQNVRRHLAKRRQL